MQNFSWTVCDVCTRSFRVLAERQGMLREPATLIALASAFLLVLAVAQSPRGLFVSEDPAASGTPLYLASALVGSVFIWYTAAKSLLERNFTAEVPVSVATAGALAIGQYAAAAVVAVLLLLGGTLERIVADSANRALEALARLLPDQVTVRRDGHDTVIPIAAVRVGDTVIVHSGERVAVDGEILVGSATINEAAITGESLPVEKQVGDGVFAGTMNEVGALEVRATKVGEESTLGQIKRMVREAQGQKAPVERILNRYAKFYTPAALTLGAIVWWWSGDLLRGLTVLIVFCPCAMVLATPTALVASIGNAALRGSLVKRGATVETLARIDIVAFDKTGTLTEGAPQLVEVAPWPATTDGDQADLLALAAVAEKLSEHPLGKATVRAAEERGLEVADPATFEVLPGQGVRAEVETHEILLGRPRLLTEHGVAGDPALEARVAALAAEGRSVIVAAVDGAARGLLLFEDAPRERARSTVARLNELGLRTVLVSGDHPATAARVAGELGIAEAYGGVMPDQKVEIVRQLQSEGRTVAFVGDGINDGPALAAANIGVAMGKGGTDVAIETADVTLLSDDLARLPHLLALSRQALRAIRQNLFFSLGVLIVALGLTIPGILTPVTGALLHELSSIPIIANSGRLIAWKTQE